MAKSAPVRVAALSPRMQILDATTRQPPERVLTHTRQVSCDGGGGALGHPLVFYDMGQDSSVTCLYCGREFVFQPGGEDDHDH